MKLLGKYFLLVSLLLLFGCKAQAQQFKTHAVKRGETLESVARLYQVSTEDLLRFNKEVKEGEPLRPNTILAVPITGGEVVNQPQQPSISVDSTGQVEPIGFQTHRVKRKETLFSISRRYEIPEERIKRYNPELYSRSLQRGMVLRIPRYPTGWDPYAVIEAPELMSYEVLPKETRWSIAHKFNITVDSLLVLNPELPGNTSYLAAGQELKLPKPPGTDAEEAETQAYVSYTVPTKKTLFSLSQEYGISREEIIRLNPEILERGNLQEGMVLRLPEKKTDTLQGGGKYVYYEVKPKQTEYSLTRKLGVGYADLLALNPQLARGLQAGMVLKIPRDRAGTLEVKNDLVLETFDLKDSINTQHIPKLLVLLPFRLDRLDLEDTESTRKRIEQNNALQYSLGLYSGLLIALDSIAELGMSVEIKTLDTGRRPQQLQCHCWPPGT
jgi:LysM repeat protein